MCQHPGTGDGNVSKKFSWRSVQAHCGLRDDTRHHENCDNVLLIERDYEIILLVVGSGRQIDCKSRSGVCEHLVITENRKSQNHRNAQPVPYSRKLQTYHLIRALCGNTIGTVRHLCLAPFIIRLEFQVCTASQEVIDLLQYQVMLDILITGGHYQYRVTFS